MDSRLAPAFWALRIGIGLAAFLAGLDKFFNILADWTAYLAPPLVDIVPLSPAAIMGTVGVIEMAAGLLLLAGVTRLGGYVVMGWLLLIAASLVVGGHYFDVAVRDVIMAIAAFTLARLSEVRAEATNRLPAGSRLTRSAAGV